MALETHLCESQNTKLMDEIQRNATLWDENGMCVAL